ncbi:CehA/McbA family metallohydrolase [uncultured Clostridium sp.]|uniref:CehA/McbA family metallohydrolase n=1 Tax=uncultured Clostridium sp. TaxID=59620 RepID=UPI0025F7EBCA|nr:CehA/McbA family metallohydrolase [uncultured Clostridium sp.]
MKNKKLIALVMAATMSFSLITPKSQITYASAIQMTKESGDSEQKEILVFEENFAGNKDSVNSTNDGWVFSRDLGGYDSSDNYNTAPSVALGKGTSTGKTDVISTPEFTLENEGKLSFYLKSQGIKADSTSAFIVKGFNANGEVTFEEVFDSAKLSRYVGITEVTVESIPSETTKINFEYTKNVGNLTFDDVRLTYVEPEEEIEGLVTIEEARKSTEEVIVKGIVTFKEASGSSYNYAIEDKTGGIALRGVDGLEVGDEVVVKGTPSTFKGLIQINGYNLLENKGEKTFPLGKVVTISDIVDNAGGENFESQVVKITDLIVEDINLTGNTKLVDANGKFIYLYKATDLGDIKVGDKVEVVATLSQYSNDGNGGYQLRINNSSQVTKIESEIPEVPEVPEEDKIGPTVVKVTPGNSSNVGENRRPEITATFEDESGVDMETVKLTFNGEDVTAELVKEENKVKYTVNEDLTDGKYTVKVEVKDTLGNLTIKEWKFTVGEQESNLYFGQLHSHTNLSDGQGSIDEAYTYARDVANVDFVAVTDHSNWFDNDTLANMGDGSVSEDWQLGLSTADKYNEDGEFTAIYGFEMTWSGSTGGYGHINTFNTPGFETRTNRNMDLKNYYETLKQYPESLSQLNHPGKTFGNFSDYAHYDAAIDEVVTLIEVGNGEGAIRSSGYFPSYEEYTRALDKGWHVSPTNNQDNHKGKWGNANTARTVIEASELTREALYEAISERRTYATEDENLRISYTVNGSTMGSILDDTGSLEFKINVEDIDAGDNIKKISIIGDGGKVVNSIDNINSTKKEWTFTLDNNVSSYYYVRVDQVDQDIAVTAPVWVGERENVGIESVDCDTELVVENEKINIATTVYNNEATELKDVEVEYYIDDATEPVVSTIESIASASTGTATLSHSFEKAGEHKISVVVKANINGNEREFKGSIDIKVSKASAVSKVIIDGAHQNQYVTGDYSGKITTLTGLMTQNGIKSVLNKEPITDETLEGASLLILSDPQSTSKESSGLTPQKYTEEELKAIAKFAENGGNIIITSKADYGDGVGEYGNAAQGNAVLEAIGAKIRFNDDQATDDVENGGQSYRLYFNDYNTESTWLKDVDTSKNYSFYSGSTLIMPEDTSNIEVLVKGHETTYGNDADNQGDNTPVEKGDVVGLAVETLESGAQVFVSGATFFSDFEIDGYVYSNFDITSTVLRELAPTPELPVSKIADVRVDLDGDNNPDRFGETVVIEGYVTAASNAAAKGNSFFDVIYVQDETAGLTVFGVSSTEVKLGQKVRLTGKVSSYLGDAQIALTNELYDLEIIDESINLVEPTKLSTADSMLEEKEGLLVQVSGEVTRIEGQNIYVNDGTGESRVYIEGYIGSSTNPGVADEWKSRVKVGDMVSAIGLASEDPEGHRLRVRDSAEIVVLENDIVDEEEVKNVEDMILKLPEVSLITLEDKARIYAIREAYNSLTDAEKALVSKELVNILEAVEAKIAELENEESDKPQAPGVEVKPEGGNGSNTGLNNASNSNNGTVNGGSSALPNTGGVNSIVYVVVAIIIVAAGVIVLFKKKSKK